MKIRVFLALTLFLSVDVLYALDSMDVHKFDAWAEQSHEQSQTRAPASVEEDPKGLPKEERLKNEGVPEDLPWGRPYRNRIDWDINHIDTRG